MSKSVVITEASVLSLPALSRLFAKAVREQFNYFAEPVQTEVIREHSVTKLYMAAVDPRRVVLIAKLGDRVIGYAIGAAPKVGPAQLFWLYVEPDHRGNRLGLKLLSRMLHILGAKGAETVSIATHDHRYYYERQGFVFLKNTVVDGVNMDILTFKIRP
jgi:predicted N-acetyltransferase YhbS